jgi:glycosyltransferase involved in cell wall biosynthesis
VGIDCIAQVAEGKPMKASADKNILYLSYDGLTDPLGQSQILPYLAGLSEAGYSITIISFEKPERFTLYSDKIRAYCTANKLLWEPLLYHKSPPVLSTFYDLTVLRKHARQLHHERNFSIVHCRSYITALTGLWLKKKYGIRFIFDMRGFWADERVEGGLWNLNNLLYRSVYTFFKKKEREFLQAADAVIVLTEAARQVVLSWKVTDQTDNVTVIPCCVDLGIFNPAKVTVEKQAALRTTLGLSANDYIVLYLGSIGTWYLWNDMVSFYKKIKAQRPSAKFLVLTPDQHLVNGDDSFIVLAAAREEVPVYISISNLSVCFIKPSFSKKGSSATKMAEVLAMGIPVVTNAGWGDVEFLRGRVKNLYVLDNPEEQPTSDDYHADHQDEFFHELFSLQSGVAKYRQVYTTLLI